MMYALKLVILSLLKISYEVSIGMLILMSLMAIVTLVTGDRCYFTKKFKKLRRYMYGKS